MAKVWALVDSSFWKSFVALLETSDCILFGATVCASIILFLISISFTAVDAWVETSVITTFASINGVLFIILAEKSVGKTSGSSFNPSIAELISFLVWAPDVGVVFFEWEPPNQDQNDSGSFSLS